MNDYLIIIEKQKNCYSAYSPDVDGCIATAKTIDEARSNYLEALEMHLKGLKEDKLPIPKPKSIFTFSNDVCNGVLNVRCKKSTHLNLIQLAKKENVSVSHLVNDAIVKQYG